MFPKLSPHWANDELRSVWSLCTIGPHLVHVHHFCEAEADPHLRRDGVRQTIGDEVSSEFAGIAERWYASVLVECDRDVVLVCDGRFR
jgi:hypothetical protein